MNTLNCFLVKMFGITNKNKNSDYHFISRLNKCSLRAYDNGCMNHYDCHIRCFFLKTKGTGNFAIRYLSTPIVFIRSFDEFKLTKVIRTVLFMKFR